MFAKREALKGCLIVDASRVPGPNGVVLET